MNALMKAMDAELLKSIQNVTKRMSYITTHLISLVIESEADLKELQRNIPEGKRIMDGFRDLKSNLQQILNKTIALNSFEENRKEFIKHVGDELIRLQETFKSNITINEFSVERELKELHTLMQEENAEQKLIVKLHEDFMNMNYGRFRKVFDALSGKEKFFPKEHENLKTEILSYLSKLVGAFHELSKIITGLERLGNEEEAQFGYLYQLIGDVKHVEEHKTQIQSLIHTLEKEFVK